MADFGRITRRHRRIQSRCLSQVCKISHRSPIAQVEGNSGRKFVGVLPFSKCGGCRIKCSTRLRSCLLQNFDVLTLQVMMKSSKAFNFWSMLPEVTAARRFFVASSSLPKITVELMFIFFVICFQQRFFPWPWEVFFPKLQFHDHREVDIGMLQRSHCSKFLT